MVRFTQQHKNQHTYTHTHKLLISIIAIAIAIAMDQFHILEGQRFANILLIKLK